MTWNEFLFFALPSVTLWLSAGILVYSRINRKVTDVLMITGIVVFAAFIAGLWIGQERPPMRTMGETRLWYSFFLSLVGFVTYKHWKYQWLLSFSSLVACVFVCINILKPEIHSKNLMPALQSYWFVPHVTVYILSYAMLGAATIASIIQLRKLNAGFPDPGLYRLMDNLVYAGFGFLMLGMLMGCVWAKEAWGHYWTWDPKETWAFLTAAAYLVYIHARLQKYHPKFTLWVLPVAFILLMITWIGVNYLPSAQHSIHIYK
ncbi:MAG: cytochrome c biogenesis protein CcsA [Dysgonamonadaceae bacterium]|jgi:ABC-type transport system involved in cytochrome c biogenesis permease subunit|nr:cytochrome c biogenesis protein CcsA [Dysgonamonadaceae bacterium]